MCAFADTHIHTHRPDKRDKNEPIREHAKIKVSYKHRDEHFVPPGRNIRQFLWNLNRRLILSTNLHILN